MLETIQLNKERAECVVGEEPGVNGDDDGGNEMKGIGDEISLSTRHTTTST